MISRNKEFVISQIILIMAFLPFLFTKTIGSDWDSYALIGTFLNFENLGIYTPSRPPGFPIHETIVGLTIYFAEILNFSKEQALLIVQLVIGILLNYVIFAFLIKRFEFSKIFYFCLIFSPIYVISIFSIIDYTLGALFGFSAVYMYLYKKEFVIILVSLLLALSAGARLSNLIFLFAILFFELVNKENLGKVLKIILLTFSFTFIIYLPFYNNLLNLILQNNPSFQIKDLVCVFNLTNTELPILERLGRFILKQINLLGLIGSIIMVFLILSSRLKIENESKVFVFIFIFFELSFLRLPTEEGHLLPALISLFFIVANNKINKNILVYLLIATVFSNFVNINFYSVDKKDSASEITVSPNISTGYLYEDFNDRKVKGVDKNFHYENSKYSLIEAWSYGCPN